MSRLDRLLVKCIQRCPVDLGVEEIQLWWMAEPDGVAEWLGGFSTRKVCATPIVDSESFVACIADQSVRILPDLAAPESRSWIVTSRTHSGFEEDSGFLILVLGSAVVPFEVGPIDLPFVTRFWGEILEELEEDSVQPTSQTRDPLFDALLESVPFPILILDESGQTLGLNRNFEHAFESPVAAAEARGLHLTDCLNPEIQAFFQRNLASTLRRHFSVEVPLVSGKHDYRVTSSIAATSVGKTAVIFVARPASFSS